MDSKLFSSMETVIDSLTLKYFGRYTNQIAVTMTAGNVNPKAAILADDK